jgi:hypothetical protein
MATVMFPGCGPASVPKVGGARGFADDSPASVPDPGPALDCVRAAAGRIKEAEGEEKEEEAGSAPVILRHFKLSRFSRI